MNRKVVTVVVIVLMAPLIIAICILKLLSAFMPDGPVTTAGTYDVTQTAVYQSVKEATEPFYSELWEQMEKKKDEVMKEHTEIVESTEDGIESTEQLCDITVTIRMNYIGDAYLIAYLVYSEGIDVSTAKIDVSQAKNFLNEICEIKVNESGKEYEVTNEFLSAEQIAEKYFSDPTKQEEFKESCYLYSQFFDVSTAKVETYKGNTAAEDAGLIFANTSMLDVPLYLQYDSKWANVPYGNGNIRKNGCCPTCLAMVFSYLKKSTIYPDDVVAWCKNQFYVNGQGTSWWIFSNTYTTWGVKCSNIGKSQALMVQALQKGKPVIASMGPGEFTKGGHFIVLSGITTDGKIKVKDPNDSASKNHVNTDFAVSLILRECKNMWVCE